jgi:hypothetical protein
VDIVARVSCTDLRVFLLANGIASISRAAPAHRVIKWIENLGALGEPQKIAARPASRSTVTLKWIAHHLSMGAPGYLSTASEPHDFEYGNLCN